MQAALAWLEKEQEAEGSWFGRWGVNYVYGTWSVLCALGRAGIGRETPMVAKAVGADAVVVVHRAGRGGLEVALRGSVAAHVVRAVEVPVAVLHK